MPTTAENRVIDWEKVISLYNSVKAMYALCEETDPDLCTNLQPLNEFRAALDHLMRIVAIQNVDEYKNKDATDEARKLQSHLRRAFFDICDMLSINYRGKIVSALKKYDVECIQGALPDYYPTVKPRLQEISEIIATLRTGKRFNGSGEETAVDEYLEIVTELKQYYRTVLSATASLNELRTKTRVKKAFVYWIIPIGGVIVGAVIGVIGWFL